MNLFVYGTLRPGASRHHLIEGRVTATMEAHIEGRLFVMPSGEPVLVEGGDASAPVQLVRGDLLLLPDSPVVLSELDRLEGVSDPRSIYQRVRRRVQTERGDDMAFLYVCKGDEAYRVAAEATEIPEGDWFYWERPTP